MTGPEIPYLTFRRARAALALRMLAVPLIAAALLAWCSPLCAQLRVINIGSNIVVGNDGLASYRYAFYFKLKEAGYDVDFVGDLSTDRDEPDEFYYPLLNTEYDRDYQAWYNRISQDIAETIPSAAARYEPDVAVIMLSYDLRARGEIGVGTIESSLREIIASLRSVNPGVIVLLPTKPPGTFQGSEFIPDLNARIEAVAAETDTFMSPVELVDLNTGYRESYIAPNGWMPNHDGEDFIAARLLQALNSAVSGSEGWALNPGFNDAWYDPATSGQGFFIIVFPKTGVVFLAWFTYDRDRPPESVDAILGDPGHRWMTAIGPIDGPGATLEVTNTSGGVFDSEQPRPTNEPYGTIALSFEDCSRGRIEYDLPAAGVSGSVPIQRVVQDNVALCELLKTDSAE